MTKKSIPVYLEPQEVRAVINAIPSISKYPDRDVLIVETMWQSGCRVGELDLVPERIGSDSLVLRNLKQGTRSRGSDGKMKWVPDPKATKEVIVSESLCNALKDYCVRNGIKKGEYIFTENLNKERPISTRTGQRYLQRMLEKAGEAAMVFKPGKNNPKTGRRYKGPWPHIFRHSNASYLQTERGNLRLIQKQLGHSDVRNTVIYADISTEVIRKELKGVNWGIEPEKKRKRKKKELK